MSQIARDSQQVLWRLSLNKDGDGINAGGMQTLDSITTHVQDAVTALTA